MSIPRITKAMEYIDDDLVSGAATYKKSKKKRAWTRWSSLAACICLVFVVSVTTAFAMNLGGIREWFAYEWEVITGNAMTSGHTAVIDHLSQDIGISKTVDDVTITVDSATAGRDSFYLLLRVDGLDMKKGHSYNFHDVELRMTPDPVQELSAFAGYGLDYLGIDENWNSVFLFSYDYSGTDYLDSMSPFIQVDLALNNIVQDGHTDREKTIKEADWYFAFTLDYQKAFETVSLSNIDVIDEGSNKTYMLTDIELTNTGLHFRYSLNDMDLDHLPTTEIRAILKNGAEIFPMSGVGSPTDDNSKMVMTYTWRIPLNLDEVDSIRICGQEIPVE